MKLCHHNCDTSNLCYHFCETCSEPFCINYKLEQHHQHKYEPLDQALRNSGNIADRTIYVTMNAINRIHEEMKNVEVSTQALLGELMMETRYFKMFMQHKGSGKVFEDEEYRLQVSLNSKCYAMKKLKIADVELRKFLNLLKTSLVDYYGNAESSKIKYFNPMDLNVLTDNVLAHIFRLHAFLKNELPPSPYYPAAIKDEKPIHASIPIGLGAAVPCWKEKRKVYIENLSDSSTKVIYGPTADSFCRPWGIACDGFGCMVIADRSNNQVLVYEVTGQYIRSIGQQGTGLGQFNKPAGVAIDMNQRIVVSDKDNHRIQIFNTAGDFLCTFGKQGSSYGEFHYPWDVAVNSLCQIAVSDTKNNRVQLFSPNGTFLKSFGHVNSKYIMNIPRGICFTPVGNLVVCDFNNHRIIEINSDFTTSDVIVDRNDYSNKFINRPQGIVVDDAGNLIFADCLNHRVQIRNKYGKFIRTLKCVSAPYSPLKIPSGVALTPEGQVFLVDFGNDRIVVW